ncbi:hypothetical protein RQM65_02175 [Pricia sp. S334]|uniref:Uncharacterized protein n=1 Tax=Pricia mediterranea TaxID=3076079 RepID=A0ABU3L2Q5_9FLAO|nr:hypothetical protein [Pricia sp. S334]MDT7827469.1 hypothetical protein [Pricia sp. S334]
MKHLIVLSVAVVMLVKPLWPIAEYVVNYDYIVNVLCENKDRPELQCNGKCYLVEQLAKESESNDKNPFGENRSVSEIQPMTFYELADLYDFGMDFLETDLDNFKTSQVFIKLLFTSDILQPPEKA